MKENENVFMKLLDKQVEMLFEAKKRIKTELNKCNLPGLVVKQRGGAGNGLSKNSDNDRRMYVWITTEYLGKEYCINLFKSEIDCESGNCHSQIGRVMFTKGYIKNKSTIVSPNEIVKDSKGKFKTNKQKTELVFYSDKWVNPFDLFLNKDRERLVNKHWISIDDILNDKNIVTELVDAFVVFIKSAD